MVNFTALLAEGRATRILEKMLKPKTTKDQEHIKLFVEQLLIAAREFAKEDRKWDKINEKSR